MQISIMLEGQAGLTWEAWKQAVAHADGWGIKGLYTSDHFSSPTPPNRNALEMMVATGYAAAFTARVDLGPMVAPVSFRDPVMLTRQALMLNELSGGRFVLGVGAGWMEREHRMFGYALGNVRTRMARFAEGLNVIYLLVHAQGPVDFHGSFYNLNAAELKPRTRTMRILVGGNGVQKTLKLAAQYGDVWNGVHLRPETFRELSIVLDRYATIAGRDPLAIKHTHSTPLFFGDTPAEMEKRLAYVRTWRDEYATMPVMELVATLRGNSNAVVGTRTEVIEQLRAYAQAGVEEMVLQWFDPLDLEGMEIFADEILPRVVV